MQTNLFESSTFTKISSIVYKSAVKFYSDNPNNCRGREGRKRWRCIKLERKVNVDLGEGRGVGGEYLKTPVTKQIGLVGV